MDEEPYIIAVWMAEEERTAPGEESRQKERAEAPRRLVLDQGLFGVADRVSCQSPFFTVK